jgi:hypothetical protein
MSALIDGKVVVSHHLPPMPNTDGRLPSTVKEVVYMAWRTRYDGKTIVTGIAVGRVEGESFKVSETGQGVINSMAKSPDFKGRLVVVECRKSKTGNSRIVSALKAVNDGDGLLVICKDSSVYDDVHIHQLFGVEKTPVE